MKKKFITAQAFQKWLESRPKSWRGKAFDPSFCPLARASDFEIGAFTYREDCFASERHDLPKWARTFIYHFDRSYGKMTAPECVSLMKRIRKGKERRNV